MPKTETKTKLESKPKTKNKYTYSVGRRKRAIARIRLFEQGKGEIIINNKPSKEYLPDIILQQIIHMPLELTDLAKKVDITILVKGGGKKGQAEAIRLGIARALEKLNKDLRKKLKAAGFLTRDSRIKERKKPGLKRARRAPQWKKR